MRLSFYFYSRLALGKQLARVVEACRSTELAKPERVLLTSREGRDDLSVEAVVAAASSSSSDSCEIRTTRGTVSMAWVYGERRHIPRLWGSIAASEIELGECVRLLDTLAAAAGVTYGVCDLEEVRQRAMRAAPDMHGAGNAVSALEALYWYNYFGPEFRQLLRVSEVLKGAVTELSDLEHRGLRVLLAPTPREAAEPGRSIAVTRAWPFFRRYDSAATFTPNVKIDYSEVWGLPAPDMRPRSMREVVGDPDEFIATASRNSERFREWAKARGLRIDNEEDIRQVFRDHESIVRDELLLPAIAAYGEIIRAQSGGVWRKATLLHRGEPVVATEGRPWTARRVILEALEALSPTEL